MASPFEEDEKAILSVITSFLDCIKTGQIQSMRDCIIPEAGAIMERADGQVIKTIASQLIDTLQERVKKYSADTVIEEWIHDTLVKVDENLGMAYGPYTCTLNGKLRHFGTANYALLRTRDGWKISGVFDNQELPNT